MKFEGTPHQHAGAQGIILLAIGLTLALAGCTAAGSAPPLPEPSESLSSDNSVPFPMPDIGPSPAPDPLSDDQIEQMRVAQQDDEWQHLVLLSYPDADRPEIAFRTYTPQDQYGSSLESCFVENELGLEMAVDESGDSHVSGAIVNSESAAIAQFRCRSTVVLKPAPMNVDQIEYRYDYLTKFLAPCLEANGVEVSPAPDRRVFVEGWPQFGWYPSTGNSTDPKRALELAKTCPGPSQ